MSQKTRRVRRQTTEEETDPFKAPTPKPNGSEPADESQPEPEPGQAQEETDMTPEQNGTEKETEKMLTRSRSRSATPQLKKTVQNGHEVEEKKEEEKSNGVEEKTDSDSKDNKEIITKDSDNSEMEPLLLSSDEADPELAFEENSDLDSGRSSPILTRCKTRRSESRNAPTPKTPKLVAEENEDVPPSPAVEAKESEQDLNSTFESCSDDVSTKAEAGNDSTRLDYINKDGSNLENNAFLKEAKNKSFGETLKHLSTRRTIRPISEEYRKKLLLLNNADKIDYSANYPVRKSVERLNSFGLKRKNSTESEDEHNKRFKSDSPGFFARLTSPLSSIRNPFRSDIPSSTPKLTSYKDDNCLLEDEINSKLCEVQDEQRRWCSIM